MLMPRKVKHRKHHRGRMKGRSKGGTAVNFGDYGIQALEPGWITARQIEAGRIAGNHFLRGEGKIRIRIFPDKPVTATPAETRMGKGKGEVEFWCAVVRPGQVLYEIQGASEASARIALNRIAHKMPVKVRMVSRRPKV